MDDEHTGFGPDTPARHFRPSDAEAPRPRHGDHRAGDRSGHHRVPHRGALGTGDRAAALVDARFWSWLHDDDHDGGARMAAAHEELQALMQAQGSRLQRVLWFSDQEIDGRAAGMQIRRVPSNAQDQGVTMLRAMAHELQAMAERRAVDRVLLVSDDDRLLLAVDEAQRHGLQVDMLVDADSQDLKDLQGEDPNWASLLMSADRLVVLGSGEAMVRGQRPRTAPTEPRIRREAPSAQASGIIEDEILSWWDDQSTEQREQWRHEVQATRGIPQELDRQLLLRISRRLGQALSPAEKSAMRNQVRLQVLGPNGQDAPQGQDRYPSPLGREAEPALTTTPAGA